MRVYGALQFGFRPLRVTYVIDKMGVIRGAVHHEILIDRQWRSVITVLRGIKIKE